MPGVVWSVGMHNVFKIALVVRREPLTITLSVEGCADLKTIVHFYHARDKVLHVGGWTTYKFESVSCTNSTVVKRV